MSNNHTLRSLHFERVERMNKALDTKCEALDTKCEALDTKCEAPQNDEKIEKEFCCAVCYTNEESSGLVIPKNCTHKICLTCYSNLILIHKSNSTCPECRALYLNPSDLVESSTTDSDEDIPDLVPYSSISSTYNTTLWDNAIINQIISANWGDIMYHDDMIHHNNMLLPHVTDIININNIINTNTTDNIINTNTTDNIIG